MMGRMRMMRCGLFRSCDGGWVWLCAVVVGVVNLLICGIWSCFAM
jgi:hypothetical protein